MQRKAVALEPRYSLWQSIPETYRGRQQENQFEALSFFEHLVASFDAVLAPVHASIEDIDLYVDPRTCPPDFLPWLAGWLGLSLNQRWTLSTRRDFVVRAAEVFRHRGTTQGLRDAIHLFLGVAPDVEDSGGATWSRVPFEPVDGARPAVSVTVPGQINGEPVDLELVEQVASSFVPPFVEVSVRAI